MPRPSVAESAISQYLAFDIRAATAFFNRYRVGDQRTVGSLRIGRALVRFRASASEDGAHVAPVVVLLDGEADEAVDEFGVGDPARLP